MTQGGTGGRAQKSESIDRRLTSSLRGLSGAGKLLQGAAHFVENWARCQAARGGGHGAGRWGEHGACCQCSTARLNRCIFSMV